MLLKRMLYCMVCGLVVPMVLLSQTVKTECGSNDTAGQFQIPLRWAQDIHEAQLHHLLSSIRADAVHPVFSTFIAQRNGSVPATAAGGGLDPTLLGAKPTLLGAGPTTVPNMVSLQDLDDVDSERRAVARDAFCKLRKMPVPVPRPSDPLVLYTPPCVMLRRCSGCCGHELLECVPTQVKNVRKKVLALRFTRVDQVSLADQSSSIKRITMEKHVKCACQCKVKSSDCSIRQRYDAPNCRCFCPNEHQSSSCPGIKIWSSDDCACKCSRVEECSTGLEFDLHQCRCMPSGSSQYRGSLFFRADTSTRAVSGGTAASSARRDWGAGMSSVGVVDPPAPRKQQRLGAVSGAQQPAQGRSSWPTSERPIPGTTYRQSQQRQEYDARQRRLDQQREEQIQREDERRRLEWQMRRDQQRRSG